MKLQIGGIFIITLTNKKIGIATRNLGKFSTFCKLLDELDLEVVFLNELKTVD